MHGQDSRVRELGETCTTVTSKWGTGGGNVPVALQPIAFSGQMSNPQTDVDMTQTLQAKNPMAVCLGGQHPNAGIGIDQSPTLTEAMGAGGGHIPITSFNAQTAWSMNLMSPGRQIREDDGVGALTQDAHRPTQGNEAVVIQQAMASEDSPLLNARDCKAFPTATPTSNQRTSQRLMAQGTKHWATAWQCQSWHGLGNA
jgi:hypothetical protein